MIWRYRLNGFDDFITIMIVACKDPIDLNRAVWFDILSKRQTTQPLGHGYISFCYIPPGTPMLPTIKIKPSHQYRSFVSVKNHCEYMTFCNKYWEAHCAPNATLNTSLSLCTAIPGFCRFFLHFYTLTHSLLPITKHFTYITYQGG